jgi:exodeoxyribonuclease VII small subunit
MSDNVDPDDPNDMTDVSGVNRSDELDAPGYADALAELESILAELERGEADIDHLAERVGRAAELLELCRGRLEGAQVEVTRILAGLDQDPDDAEPAAPPT